jgi:hypothetical protein
MPNLELGILGVGAAGGVGALIWWLRPNKPSGPPRIPPGGGGPPSGDAKMNKPVDDKRDCSQQEAELKRAEERLREAQLEFNRLGDPFADVLSEPLRTVGETLINARQNLENAKKDVERAKENLARCLRGEPSLPEPPTPWPGLEHLGEEGTPEEDETNNAEEIG